MPESTELVQIRVVGIDSKYTASTNKYAVAEVSIADNDPFLDPVQKVYFGEGDLVAQPGANGGMFVFKRTVADSYLTVNYTVGSSASGYTLGGGYGGSTSATFMPEISEVSVNLTINTSGPPATSGAVTVTITPSANYEIWGSKSNSVDIYSTGGPGPWINVFRRVDPVGNTLNEGGDKGQFVVSRYYAYPTGPPPQSIPTPPPFPDFALGGTAREGVDYTATKQGTTVMLPPLGSSMTFIDGYEVEIAPLADGVYDSGEWVDFALIPNEQSIVPSSANGYISVTLPISDAGTPPKPQISIVAPDPNASELATSSGMYRIMRNDVNLPQTLTINYAFDPTDLTDPATFYDDYTITSSAGGLASSGSLTFPAGVAMIEVKLTPVDDSKLENDELAQLILLSGSAYVVDATKSKALILIVDKEEKPQIIITDRAEVEATELKVAKWNDAYEVVTMNGRQKVRIKGPVNTTNFDFIDRDNDRFNVWVKDSVKWRALNDDGVTPSHLHTRVKISTSNVSGFVIYNDDATEVDLVRYKGGTNKGDGWFWSDSQMLVSNKYDDIFSSASYLSDDDAAPNGEGLLKHGFKWEISDRTHRIALDGSMKAEYQDAAGRKAQVEVIANVVKNVKVHGIILNKAANMPSITKADAEAKIFKANEQFAQVGIRFVANVENPEDPPDNVDLSDGLEQHAVALDGTLLTTPEEDILVGNVPRTTARKTAALDDIELFFVNYLSKRAPGISFPAKFYPNSGYVDSIIASADDMSWVTISHEIGHILINIGHDTGIINVPRLMYITTAAIDIPECNKRISAAQEDRIYSVFGRRNLVPLRPLE